ncbi:hypothetical protein AB0B27_31120 [Micromonospora rifamycinica]|uniref:hypothetical protein n=1 Tax=Micromonospora rifamycinica TaxID=291594 RepID=UPI0033DDDF47
MVSKLTPDGLPVYRVTEIPDGMATSTMLRRLRRRPADGQPAVALLFYHGNKHAPLYKIADAEALPALSPGRQAAWTAARTCARCQATRDTPFPHVFDSSRRLCSGCRVAERLAAATPSWLRLRAAAVTWARHVVDDPDTVLFAAYRLHDRDEPIHVHATAVDGRVLVDVVARRPYQHGRTIGGMSADLLVPLLMPLVGRRLVHTITSPRGRYADHVHALTEVAHLSSLWRWEPSLCDPSIRDSDADAFGPRWTDWHARTWYNHPHSWAVYGRDGLQNMPIAGDDAAALAATMRAGLLAMATDDHPDGPPACPVLPPTGTTACGNRPGPDGVCADHAAIEEADRGNA